MSSLRALLAGLIDYAGLFPPASLSMAEAARQYSAHLGSPERWALGRFVCPASRVGELAAACSKQGSQNAERWPLTLLGTPEEAAQVQEKHRDCFVIQAVEVKAPDPADIDRLAPQLPPGMKAYFEIALNAHLAEALAACARHHVRAKVRTGGLTPESIPSPQALAGFLTACCRAGVPFKATAGLHHPVRSVHALSDAPGAPSATMHGFLNVFLAAALLWSGGSEADALATLQEENPAAFCFGDELVRWHAHSLSEAQIHDARRQFAIGFGSCSFADPVSDLQALAWL